jgi:hypothetical protein
MGELINDISMIIDDVYEREFQERDVVLCCRGANI